MIIIQSKKLVDELTGENINYVRADITSSWKRVDYPMFESTRINQLSSSSTTSNNVSIFSSGVWDGLTPMPLLRGSTTIIKLVIEY